MTWILIALVLVVSRGLANSGAIELLARKVVSGSRSLAAHIGVMSGVGAALSALMATGVSREDIFQVYIPAVARRIGGLADHHCQYLSNIESAICGHRRLWPGD